MKKRKGTGKGQRGEEQHRSRKRQENSLGKVRLEEPTKEMTRRTKKNGRKVQREAPVNRPALLDLLAELLEEIFVRITDLEDVIALSATCCRLAAVTATVTLLHLDLLLQLVVEAGLLLAHHGLGHLSVLSGIVLWYKRPAFAGSLKQH